MIDRLELLTNRYNEINEELLKPEVLSDFNKQKKLSKEKGSIEEAVNKYAEYKDLVSEIEGLKELVMDPEMHEIASIELDEKKDKLASLTKEIEILLLPKDENDGKDIIMEIRGAAGGDEANIFAGDLFRMYSKYAEMSTSLKSNLTAIGISQKNNAVVVYLADCSQSRIKEFKNFYDNPAVVFTNMGKINTDNPCLSTQLVNTRSYTTLATISKFPIGAGDTCLISMSGDKPIYGTFAFRAQETSGQKRCGLVTAGHVVSVGQYCYDKDFNPFGICSSRIVSTGNAEASFIPCGYLDEFNINNYIGGSSSSVLSTTTNKPGEGTYVNKYGATTKRTGGYIQDIDCTVLSEDETATFSDMTLVKCTADGGDSGGIVYTYISKYNTRLTVGVVYGYPEKMGKNYLIYSKADNVLKALNLKRY